MDSKAAYNTNSVTAIMPMDVAIYAQSPDVNEDMDSLLAVSMYIYLKAKNAAEHGHHAGTIMHMKKR